jgi:hypothetical protein
MLRNALRSSRRCSPPSSPKVGMFASLLRSVQSRTSALEHLLLLWTMREAAASSDDSAIRNFFTTHGLANNPLAEEKQLRHSSVVTELYSIYEWFAEEAVRVWLGRLPKYMKYSALEERFKNSYRIGLADIVANIDKRRYRHLDLPKVIETYSIALSDVGNWEFVSDALLTHQANLRQNELIQMFNAAGLVGCWTALVRHRGLTSVLQQEDTTKPLEQWLVELVEMRNDASHGVPDEVLGPETLRTWIEFIRALCVAIADGVTHHVVMCHSTAQPDSILGIVSESLSNNIAVAKFSRGSVRVGDSFHFLRESNCITAQVLSIQLNGKDFQTVDISASETEVGMRLTSPVTQGAKVLALLE